MNASSLDTSLNRRTWLRLGATATAGFALPGRAFQTRLAKVNVSSDRIIRSIAGLRPYRPTGFVLRAQSLGDKLLIHNYGHGGCGITLSWGTAKMAVELALAHTERKAAVLGSGVIGLATARLLQDHGFDVTIYARELPPETTSNAAGGIWMPYTICDGDKRTSAFDSQLTQASRFSHRYFQTLTGDRYGVRWMPAYFLSDESEFIPPWMFQLAPELYRSTNLRKEENPFGERFASRIQLMLIEPAIFLCGLMSDFRIAGGRIIIRDFRDISGVSKLTERVIVNCTGLGSKVLFNDSDLTPIKGQLAMLTPQPELDYAYASGPYYMLPRSDGVVLGGTHERGVSTPQPEESAITSIVEGHKRIVNAMR